MADWEPSYILAELVSGRFLKEKNRPFTLKLCGSSRETIKTMGGIILKPDLIFENINPDLEDIVILPGADIWLNPSQDKTISFVNKLLEKGILVACICGATMGLANHGLLDHRPHTSNDLNVLKIFCPNYKGEQFYEFQPAVTDRNLITASGLNPVEFAYHVFKILNIMKKDTVNAWYNLYSTQKPEYYYALMESLATK